jgi:PmbA protein
MKPLDLQHLLELAQKAGAEAAEAYQTTGLGRSVQFEANRLKQIETGEEQGIALRVWYQGRPGLAVAQGSADLDALVEKAIALSAFGVVETPELCEKGPELAKKTIDRIAVESLIAFAQEAIGAVRDRYPQAICSGGYSEEVSTVRLINTTGLDVSHTSHSLDGYLGAEWTRGDDFLQVYEGETVVGTAHPRQLAALVCQKLEWANQSSAVSTAAMPVLLTTKAVDTLLGAVMSALNGRQVLQKASPWCTLIGEQVLSPLVTLSQDPKRLPYETPFDDEGTPTVFLDFVKAGVLRTFYGDRATSRQLGIAASGNGFRGDLGSYPRPGLFNLIIAPGNIDLSALIATMDNGLIVDQVLGSGASISGEFSVNIDLGYHVVAGKVVGRVKDTMIAGNAYECLKNIVALSSEQNWEGSLVTPSILLESIAVTART